ncbi:MAG: hypothetical protein MUF53_04615 [Gemmatimonadaceae bacterium]|nr:hypothetical protein [Gemmatimonadaceae bacterium]
MSAPTPSPDTLPDFEDLWRTYRGAPDRLASAVRGLSDVQADQAGTVGAATIRLAIARLVDEELVSALLIRRLLAEPGVDLPDHDADAWLESAAGTVRLDAAVQAFAGLRRLSAELVRELPEPAWLHNAPHPRLGRLNLAQHFLSRTTETEAAIAEILAGRRARNW